MKAHGLTLLILYQKFRGYKQWRHMQLMLKNLRASEINKIPFTKKLWLKSGNDFLNNKFCDSNSQGWRTLKYILMRFTVFFGKRNCYKQGTSLKRLSYRVTAARDVIKQYRSFCTIFCTYIKGTNKLISVCCIRATIPQYVLVRKSNCLLQQNKIN